MPKAVWNGVVLAESDDTVVVEGNHYFPRDSLDDRYFGDSPAHTVCPWKGLASYLDVLVDGRVNQGAAWYYPSPTPAAADIKDRVAFWKGVRIEAERPGRVVSDPRPIGSRHASTTNRRNGPGRLR